MAVEWAPHNISVNAIAPGHIVTPRLFDTPRRAEGYANSLLPLRRRGTTDDIGKAALFLLSDLAALRQRHDAGRRWRAAVAESVSARPAGPT